MKPTSLQTVYESGGPFGTAYLEPTRPHTTAGPSRGLRKAASGLELRWRALAQQLAASGPDTRTVDAMADAVLAPRPGRQLASGAVVVGSAGQVALDDTLDPVVGGSSVGGDRARWSALPDLGAFVRTKIGTRRQVVAVVDRSGADFMVRDVGRALLHHQQTEGQDHPLHKVRGGGWAHKRIHNSVEEVSERNAALVVDELVRLVSRAKPSAIVLAGEVDARSRVYSRIPNQLRPLVTTTDRGGRAAGSGDGLTAVLDQAAADAEHREREAVLDRFESFLGTGSAVRGIDDVLAALRHGAVETLLYKVDDRNTGSVPDELEAPVAIGPDPLQVARSDGELGDLAGEQIEHDKLDSAVLRACAATDADVEVLDASEAESPDGLGAVLRFAIPTTLPRREMR